MKSEKEIKKYIETIEKDNSHVLDGDGATIFENAPRALMQLSAESKLEILYWTIGKVYESKLKYHKEIK